MPRLATAPANPGGNEPFRLVTRTAEQSAADPYTFVMSTDDVDRMGDVVDVGGIDLRAFRKNPVALWNHDPDSPIGTWADVRREDGRLTGTLKLAAAKTSPLIDRLRQLIEQRVLRAVSIGFRALVAEPIADGRGLKFLKSELVECSLVSIPANAAALRIRALAPHPADAAIFSPQSAPGSDLRTRAAGASQERRQLAALGAKPMPRTIAERITALQTRSATIDAELTTIQETVAAEDDRDFSTEETETIAALTAEKAAVVKNLETLSQLEATLAAKAQPAGAQSLPGARLPAQVAKRERPGFMIGKVAAVSALALAQGKSASAVIAERYAGDDRVAACFDYMRRAAVDIADTTTPTWAAELVREDVAAFIEDMANVSVFAALRGRASAISLSGMSRISIPGRTKGGLGGAWVGEAGVIPVLQGVLNAAQLEPTKLAGITTFSRELADATNSEIETILTNGLREDTANVLDLALLDNSAKVAGVRPAGLRNGATSNASGGADSASDDLKTALEGIIAAGGGRDVVMIMNPIHKIGLEFATNLMGLPANPEVASQGTFHGKPIIESLNVAPGVVIVMDAAEFANQAAVPEVQVSQEATLTMANADATPPTQAVDFTGAVGTAGQVVPDGGILVAGGPAGAGTAGYQAMSMFQQWAVAVRLVVPVNWAMRRAGMVSVITGVDWG